MNPFVTNPQSTSISERIAYGVIFWILMRLAQRGYIDPALAEYIALGIVSGGGAVLAWWLNRPGKLLDAASSHIPENAKLVIATTPDATQVEKQEAVALANSAGEKVTARTA